LRHRTRRFAPPLASSGLRLFHPGYACSLNVIASHRVGAKRRPMMNSAKQSSFSFCGEQWIASLRSQ
jgi:hypothetical protein